MAGLHNIDIQYLNLITPNPPKKYQNLLEFTKL